MTNAEPATVAHITAHAEVKAAARDWATFSSDLQGDRDVRTYRQLPLEVDPPLHRAYRELLTPTFGRVQVAALEPALRDVARALVGSFVRQGSVEVVHELALPMVTSSIGVAFGRTQDVDEYRSWGIVTSRRVRRAANRGRAVTGREAHDRLRAVVDRDECFGFANCVSTAPDVFELDADGVSVARDLDADPVQLETAVEGCPRNAISLVRVP